MSSQPNILVICTDQQRFDALGCYGNRFVQTPTIDALAAEGALFENCYVQSPICAPSRASLFTGLYPHNHGLWANGVTLPAHKVMFTRILANAGYDCGMIGKQHFAACQDSRVEPRQDDGYRVFEWAHDPYYPAVGNHYHEWLSEHFPDLYRRAMDNWTKSELSREPLVFDLLPTEAHYSRWVADRAIAFVRDRPRADQPFFLIANFFDPHHPFGAPKEYMERYDGAKLPHPLGGADDLEGRPALLRQASLHSYAGTAFGFRDYSAEEIQAIKAGYYAMVSLIDDEVARILAILESEGLRTNTVIVFTSDHGEMLGDHRLLLKGPMMYECAVKVPLLLSWPGRIARDVRRTELVQWIDLAPTFMDVASLPRQSRMQGSSLMPLASTAAAQPSWRDWAWCEYRNSGHPYDPAVHTTMLRSGDMKLVAWHGAPATNRPREGELYDLANDPHEMNNLYSAPDYETIRNRLYELMVDVFVATEDRSQPRMADW